MSGATKSTRSRARYRRITLWSTLGILVAALVLPLTGYVWVGVQDAYAQSQSVQDTNPRANYWRAVREGSEGYSAVTGRPMEDGSAAWLNREGGTLMNGSGQNWRALRNGVVAEWGGWVVFAVIVAILVFFAINGRVGLEHGRSGTLVKRWSGWERVMHWTAALSFIVLAVTGLSLLFGRVLLIPLLGPRGFSAWAELSAGVHEAIGPWIFTPAVAFMIVMWIVNNLPEKGDLQWFLKGGGIVGSGHPSAGRLNAGEKVWFWFICTGGVACVVTGAILAFPIEWGQSRDTMQLANLIHGATALAWIAFWIGHAYIGTIGSEGSLEAMTTGYVDVNWAKQHHDQWYAEIADTAEHVQEPQPLPDSGQPATS